MMAKKPLAKNAEFMKMMNFLDEPSEIASSSRENIKTEPIYNEDDEDPQVESDELMMEESSTLETEQLFTNGVDYEILLKDAKKPRNYEELFLLSLAGSMSKLDDDEQMVVKAEFLRILSDAHERSKKKNASKNFQDIF